MSSDATLAEHVEMFLAWQVQTRGHRASTVIAYTSTLTKFVEYVGEREVTLELIEQFAARPRSRGVDQPSAATRNRDLHAIRSMYKWLAQRNLIGFDPSVGVMTAKVHRRHPKAIPDDVWMALWCSDLDTDQRVWLGLGYYVGLRRHEISSVAPHHFDLDRQLIIDFVRKGGSTYAVEYGGMAGVVCDKLPHLSLKVDVWLDELAWTVRKREGEERVAALAGLNPHDDSWANRDLIRMLKRADLPPNAFSPHALRHSCATNLMRCGLPIEVVADQLSHSSIETTRGYLATGGRLARWRRN